MKDADGGHWNATYNLGNRLLDGRPSDKQPDVGLVQTLTSLHKQHHFPKDFGVPWLWALFADLLGLTMILWAATGLLMWWQIRPKRLIGGILITLALGTAAYMISSQVDALHFGNVSASGPG